MKKILGLFLTVMCITYATSAKSAEKDLPSSLNSNFDKKDLVEQIVKDKDFNNYVGSVLTFMNELGKSHSKELFTKFLQNNSTVDEKNKLIQNLRLRNLKEFNDIGLRINQLGSKSLGKYSNLLPIEKGEKEAIISEAFKTIGVKIIKENKLKDVTPDDCFWVWMGCLGACSFGCSGNESCIWQCWAFCTGAYSACWAIAD